MKITKCILLLVISASAVHINKETPSLVETPGLRGKSSNMASEDFKAAENDVVLTIDDNQISLDESSQCLTSGTPCFLGSRRCCSDICLAYLIMICA